MLHLVAFADTFDASFAIKHDLESILGRFIPLLILSDSSPHFDVLVCAKYTAEKRLMIDISAVLQPSEYNERLPYPIRIQYC
jgi:hypothetical protein